MATTFYGEMSHTKKNSPDEGGEGGVGYRITLAVIQLISSLPTKNENENEEKKVTHHSQRHPVDLVLVFGLVLAEGRVSFEQFVQHASEAEPVGARVVGRPFR